MQNTEVRRPPAPIPLAAVIFCLGLQVLFFSARNLIYRSRMAKLMIKKNSNAKKWTRPILVHLSAWLLFIALAGAVVMSPLFRHYRIQESQRTADFQPPPFLSPAHDTVLRAVYPYSVIPGGVRNAAELSDAIAHDPVVAAHYSDFRIPNLQVVQLDRARLLHVSYRIGDHVYWTKVRMNLAKGETVLTDGVLMARSRCGNLAADVIPDTTQPSTLFTEPTEEALDTPVNSAAPVILTDTLPLESLLTSPEDSGALAVEGGESSGGVTAGAFGYGGSIRFLGRTTGTPGTGSSSVVPIVSVPEPGTLIQLSVGLIAIGVLLGFAVSPSKTRAV